MVRNSLVHGTSCSTWLALAISRTSVRQAVQSGCTPGPLPSNCHLLRVLYCLLSREQAQELCS